MLLSQSGTCSWVCVCVQCFDLTINLVKMVIPRLTCKREDKEIIILIIEPFTFAHFYSFIFFVGASYCETVSL